MIIRCGDGRYLLHGSGGRTASISIGPNFVWQARVDTVKAGLVYVENKVQNDSTEAALEDAEVVLSKLIGRPR